MINQSVHLEITGQDAHYLLDFCQRNNTEPKDVFGLFLKSLRVSNDEVQTPIQKSDFTGGLAQYANPSLIPLEETAVQSAIKSKYGID